MDDDGHTALDLAMAPRDWEYDRNRVQVGFFCVLSRFAHVSLAFRSLFAAFRGLLARVSLTLLPRLLLTLLPRVSLTFRD